MLKIKTHAEDVTATLLKNLDIHRYDPCSSCSAVVTSLVCRFYASQRQQKQIIKLPSGRSYLAELLALLFDDFARILPMESFLCFAGRWLGLEPTRKLYINSIASFSLCRCYVDVIIIEEYIKAL